MGRAGLADVCRAAETSLHSLMPSHSSRVHLSSSMSQGVPFAVGVPSQ
jgi:hypothetical protein